MFWGAVVKEGKPYVTTTAFDQTGEFPVLHLSNVSLPKNAECKGNVYLTATMEKDLSNLTIANLKKGDRESQPIDIYIHMSQNIKLSVQGANEVHLSGYFEPQNGADE